MTRLPGQEEETKAGSGWGNVTDRFVEGLVVFRETKLYAQVVSTVVLLAVAGLVAAFPVGPLARVRDGVAWVITEDYDFAGKLQDLRFWVRERGGWWKATAGLWTAGLDRIKPYLAEVAADPASDETGGVASNALNTQRSLAAAAGGPAQQVVQVRAAGSGGENQPLFPVDGGILFGFGWPPPGSGDRLHEGLDLVAPMGSPVVAVTDGKVLAVRTDSHLGRVLEINHGKVVASYTQLDGIHVHTGQAVRRGQVIATLGAPTGDEKSLPAHLHFEVRTQPGKAPVDPAAYLGLGGSKL